MMAAKRAPISCDVLYYNDKSFYKSNIDKKI